MNRESIWLDSDSNESSQSWVGHENQGYESSQSRITWSSFDSELKLTAVDTAWVKLEALVFLKTNGKILH